MAICEVSCGKASEFTKTKKMTLHEFLSTESNQNDDAISILGKVFKELLGGI